MLHLMNAMKTKQEHENCLTNSFNQNALTVSGTAALNIDAIYRLKWRQSNLWSQRDLYVVEQHAVLCELKWCRSVCYWNKIESV